MDLPFSDAKRSVIERVKASESAINLVIEAPLSVCFDAHGNPTGRRIEKDGKDTRYWYVGPGCVVMVAAMYLLRAVNEAKPKATVRLFEGFVSFKAKTAKSGGKEDVSRLREVVCNPDDFPNSLWSAEDLKSDDKDVLCSAFDVANFDCGVPAVIKIKI